MDQPKRACNGSARRLRGVTSPRVPGLLRRWRPGTLGSVCGRAAVTPCVLLIRTFGHFSEGRVLRPRGSISEPTYDPAPPLRRCSNGSWRTTCARRMRSCRLNYMHEANAIVPQHVTLS
eukprot:6763929-Pyramimonas_sp.AAC.1